MRVLSDDIMRILIVDDSELVRRGLIGMLSCETGWEVCGEARDGPEALRKTLELLPDLILLDLHMPGISGLETCRLLGREAPNAKIIVMSQDDVIQLLPIAIQAGADDCVDKSQLGDLLVSIKNIELASGPR